MMPPKESREPFGQRGKLIAVLYQSVNDLIYKGVNGTESKRFFGFGMVVSCLLGFSMYQLFKQVQRIALLSRVLSIVNNHP